MGQTFNHPNKNSHLYPNNLHLILIQTKNHFTNKELPTSPCEVLRPPHIPTATGSVLQFDTTTDPPSTVMADPHGGAPPRSLLRQPPLNSLYKQKSWSPDLLRDEAWQQRRKAVGKSGRMKRRSKSVTDEDLDELKACIELGFGFDSPEAEFDRKLSDTLPALGLYYAVNNQYKNDAICRSSTSLTASPSSDCGSPSSQSGPPPIFDQGDNPQTMRTRLKQWAQVVAFSVRQSQ